MRKSLKLFLNKQTDAFILRRMGQIVAVDRKLTADFILYLAEVDRRKLWATAGYSAPYKWLQRVHGFSERSALKRSQVARLVQKFPFLYRGLINGDYSISVLSVLSKHVKGKNAHILFSAAKGKSVNEVKAMLAEKYPEADIEDTLIKAVRPMGRNRNDIRFRAGDGFVNDLEEARALLSNRFPEGKLREVLGLSLKVLIADIKKAPRTKKVAAVAEPIPHGIQAPVTKSETPIRQRMAQRTRYIPRATSYAVEERDNRQCQYPHPDGGICGETWFIEKDHVLEFALGGAHDDDNVRLLCRAHNQLRAEQRFGKWVRGEKVECFDDFAALASPAKAAGEQGEGVG